MHKPILLAFAAFALGAAAPASIPEVGAPELARPGPAAAGVTHRSVTEPDALDALDSLAAGREIRAPRKLALTVWYPARGSSRAQTVVYRASLPSEPPAPPAAFTIPGFARREAPAAGGHYPVVVISHGYSNDPAMLSWLGENLATKGYVAVAIAHRDPPITDRSKAPAVVLQRPLDVAAVVRRIQGGLLGPLADPSRMALVGYSMGGMGVLAAAGGTIDGSGPPGQFIPPALIARYGSGGAGVADMHVTGIKAMVALAPFGGAPYQVFGSSLSALHTPLLVLAGSADRTVGYEAGPAALFASATSADRYLLTFENAGHSIGTGPAPAEMRGRLWDFDWFEDPIWRKARLNAISLHFITAFLDLQLKGDASRLAYLAVPSENSDKAGWTGPEAPHDAVSDGGSNPTWRGFVRNHQDGLTLRHLGPRPASAPGQ